MIFHENRLPADDSHEISCLICYFLKKQQNLKMLSAANYRWRFEVNSIFFENFYVMPLLANRGIQNPLIKIYDVRVNNSIDFNSFDLTLHLPSWGA